MKYQAADALFCLQTTGGYHTALDDDLPILAIGALDTSLFDLIKQDVSLDGYIPNRAAKHSSKNAPPSKNEFIAEQATEPYCRAATFYIGILQSEF